jgi:tRNA(His) 5'-end guanylyltransferase
MLFKSGVNFNDYPIHFKRGVYIQRKKILRKFTTEEIENLPLMHEARRNQNLEIERSCIELLNIPKLSSIKNKVDVLIYGKDVEKYD